jgi:hypothetical protein
MASKKTSRCTVTRGEVDLDTYERFDGEWRAIGIAAPARRALVDVGLTELAQLSKWTRTELAALHGMGPNALKKLDEALSARGVSFHH